MTFRTPEELLSVPDRLGKAYMQGCEDQFDGQVSQRVDREPEEC